MINKYIYKSDVFVLFDKNEPRSICALTPINNEIIEIKNLATSPAFQKQGYASYLLNFIFDKYKKSAKYIILGTGENLETINFYKKRGFVETHRIKNFFTKNYDHPIFENGIQLCDMIYMKKDLLK